MNILKTLIFCPTIILLIISTALSQSIQASRIPTMDDVIADLRENTEILRTISQEYKSGKKDQALRQLTLYLKDRAALRYYFNWQNFQKRFTYYEEMFKSEFKKHKKQADYHMNRYAPETKWELPFENLLGEKVTAYELRHLARQQKSSDMALLYYFENENPEYLDFWIRQVKDLNCAFEEDAYDDEGNGIYETYRGGRRIHNWLFCHNAYLYSDNYTWEDQLVLIRTFLHHGAQLQKRTKKNKYGNHHTKGLVALFEIAAFLSDFTISDKWQQQAISGLVWHLEREVNPDGFQFERSIHYHKGDIENYFRVYQLAMINGIELPQIYREQFWKLFESLLKMAQPNKYLPVFQDDTENPYAENNIMYDVMTVGTLLFKDKTFRYLSEKKIPIDYYWLLRQNQLNILSEIQPEKPLIGSTELPETGYYIMRNGWELNDCYMAVTAGLSDKKPDHQHGDMLGVVAYANGHEILPNYQVKYKEPDFPFWKNSFVKNVAIVDSIAQGRAWKGNQGGSGFGKWLILPNPEVLTWMKDEQYDYFIATHDGYTSENVSYFREILFIKAGFWLMRDHFISQKPHSYQQIWQGKFDSNETSTGYYKKWEDGSGLELIPIGDRDIQVNFGSHREKANMIFSRSDVDNYIFSTLIYPFRSQKTMLNLVKTKYSLVNRWDVLIKGQEIEDNEYKVVSDAKICLTNNINTFVLFDMSRIEVDGESITFPDGASAYIRKNEKEYKIRLLGIGPVKLISKSFSGVKNPGAEILIDID